MASLINTVVKPLNSVTSPVEAVVDPIVAPIIDEPGIVNALTLTVLQTLLAAPFLFNSDSFPPDSGNSAEKSKDRFEYDFIIIGAGSAGCTIAARLSEISDWNILLVEAGGNPPPISNIPQLYALMQHTDVDWGFRVNAPKTCKALEGDICPLPAGKMLGGSSSINVMLYARGTSENYDGWAASGNIGWDWNTVLKYFKKAEGNRNPDFVGEYHNDSGPLLVSLFGNDRYDPVFYNAEAENGHPLIKDINAKEKVGNCLLEGTQYQGIRRSTAITYLTPIKDRPNLTVIKHSFVTKILINESTKTAYGIEYERNGKVLYAYASKEVISCAGVFGSPNLLMRSGIGPAKQLNDLQISVLADLQVGQQLYDHFSVNMWLKFKPTTATYVDLAVQATEYVLNRTGRFARIGCAHQVSFLSSINRTDVADLEIYHNYLPSNQIDLGVTLRTFVYKPEFANRLYKLNRDYDIGCISLLLLQPFSSGKVVLNGTDPKNYPTIYGNYFDDPRDIATMIRGLNQQHSLLQTQSFIAAGAEFIADLAPECASMYRVPVPDEYWDCYIKYFGQSFWHPSSTVKMGPDPKTDPLACVDPRLRVHGIKNLRVSDASIMPYIVSGNLNAPTIMIGEKTSDIIKEDYGKL